ncbi:MAG: hypothetical protein Q7J15_05525 [Candidatus Desulfaltia sp.]|nr:hypothetical protein [Candidatus Desulfaltia sp.]
MRKIHMKNFIIVVVNKRKKEAVTVQKILTDWGCLIKTRLGLHEGVLDDCSEIGSIILEMVGRTTNTKSWSANSICWPA